VPGSHLPGIKVLAAEHDVATSTVHRAFELLREWGVLTGAAGRRPIVSEAALRPPAEPAHRPSADSRSGRRMLEFRLRSSGRELAVFSAEADPDSPADLGPLLRAAVRRAAGPDADVENYELDALRDGSVLRTFVMTG
jgi:integrase